MRTSFRAILICVVIAVTVSSSSAADSPELRAAAADRYLMAVPMSKILDDTFNALAKRVPPDQLSQFISQMKAVVRVDMLERISRESMVKVFTADELNALADFYSSKNGASAMTKLSTYMGMRLPAIQQEVSKQPRKFKSKGSSERRSARRPSGRGV